MAMNPKEQALIYEALRGDQAAIDFANLLFGLSQRIDDVIDGDMPDSPTEQRKFLEAVFFDLLVSLPRDPFYRQYFSELQPVMTHAFMNWCAANDLEQMKDDDELKQGAYVLRDAVGGLLTYICTMLYGREWGEKYNTAVWKFILDEPFGQYRTSVEARGNTVLPSHDLFKGESGHWSEKPREVKDG